jgi:H+/Cl- antiporter ClcA
MGVVTGLGLTIFHSLAPEAERHGADAIIDAFHFTM